MRNIIYRISVLLAMALAFAGCAKVTEYEDTQTGIVESLLYPSDGFGIDLINNDAAKINFEWDAADKGIPVYTVIFYGSDKKTEVGRFVSNDNGVRNMFSMEQKELIYIADVAGIAPESSGDLYWTVAVSAGKTMHGTAPAPNRLNVTRDATIIDAPLELYITGDGTENGTVLADALPFCLKDDGKFELYTKINGAFSLVNRNAEGARKTWYVTDGGSLSESAEQAGTFDENVYRLNVDFSAGRVEMSPVTSVELWRADNSKIADLSYSGNGSWRTEDFTVPTDGDDRYRFKATVGDRTEVWGSANTDRDAQAPENVNTDNEYFNIQIHTDDAGLNDSYRSIFKFYPSIKGMNADVVVEMNGGRYFHRFDFGFELEAPAVTALTAPAADAAVELKAQDGMKETFSWEKPADVPQLAITTFSLVFFKDAAGSETVASYDAGQGTSKDLTHVELETIAKNAGIPDEGTGTVWWGVQSKLMTDVAVSAEIRQLKLTRMKGVPSYLYLTGAATEYGNEYGQLKMTGTGKFEIYTKLGNGAYCFTDEASSEARKFVIDGTSFKESPAEGSWSEEGIYRVTVDAVRGQVSMEKIGRAYMEVCAYKESNFTMEYKGKGIWSADGIVPDFTHDPSWGGDTRFFVKMEIGGKTWKVANQKDFGGNDPETAAPERDPAYAVKFWDDNSDWDYHYKVILAYRNQNTKRLNIKLNCAPEEEFYYVYVEYLD